MKHVCLLSERVSGKTPLPTQVLEGIHLVRSKWRFVCDKPLWRARRKAGLPMENNVDKTCVIVNARDAFLSLTRLTVKSFLLGF